MKNINIIFNGQVKTDSMGGGDKIVMNIADKVTDRFNITFLTCPEGRGMLKNNFENLSGKKLNNIRVSKLGFTFAYILRILSSPLILFKNIKKDSIVWSASDFLPDTMPGFVFKLFHPRSIWISNLFLKARNPFTKEVNFSLRTLLYFFSQRISMFLFKINCDGVFVLCESDRDFLLSKGLSNVFVLQGGVDTNFYLKVLAKNPDKYEACFIGRFHYQKGLDDLLYVWQKVVEVNKKAVLALVGWGGDESVYNLKKDIEGKNLEKNIKLLGFLDGLEKVKVLKSSKVLLFPSTFESWGVVVAEGIASQTPVVAYDLEVLKHNFPQGVVFARSFDKDSFVEQTINLLHNEQLRDKVVIEGTKLIPKLDWEYSSRVFVDYLNNVVQKSYNIEYGKV